MEFYDPKTAPEVFDVVWCKLPRREDKLGPGPWVRCVLVLDVREQVHTATNTTYAAVTVAYGTGAENVTIGELREHLSISASQFRDLGLHKPTVFKLDLESRKRLPWCEKYFVPPEYVVGQNIIAGSLTESQRADVLAYFKTHGLAFPLP